MIQGLPVPLPDDAVVIRGGSMVLAREVDSVWRNEKGEYVLSTFCGVLQLDQTEDELIEEIVEGGPIPQARLRVTTAGELRRRGFELRQTDVPECHYDVILGTVLSIERVEEFVAAFQPARRNPRWTK